MTDENHTQYYPCPKCHKKGWHGVRKPTTQPNIVSLWYWSCRYCSHTKTKTR